MSSVAKFFLVVGLVLFVSGCQREDEPLPTPVATSVPAATPAPAPPRPEMTPPPTVTPTAPPKAAGKAPPIRIAWYHGLGALPVCAAKEKDWFGARDVAITLQPHRPTEKDCLFALFTETADVAYGISLTTLLETEKQHPGSFRVIGFIAETPENPIGAFVTAAEATVQSLSDLDGKRIGATGADYAVRAATIALREGLKKNPDYAVVSIAPGQHTAAGAAQAPEALYAVEVELARRINAFGEEPPARIIVQAPLAEAIGSPFPVQAIVMRAAYVNQYSDHARRFVATNDELLDWCNSSFADILPLLQRELGIADEVALGLFAPLYARIARIPVATLPRAATLWTDGADPDAPSRLTRMLLSAPPQRPPAASPAGKAQ
jgi:ABC-type nitrate/sulfonate/bicarbonate transport system substrate-binding protein